MRMIIIHMKLILEDPQACWKSKGSSFIFLGQFEAISGVAPLQGLNRASLLWLVSLKSLGLGVDIFSLLLPLGTSEFLAWIFEAGQVASQWIISSGYYSLDNEWLIDRELSALFQRSLQCRVCTTNQLLQDRLFRWSYLTIEINFSDGCQ